MATDRTDNRAYASYDNSVFINCPFDDGYRHLFNAIVFAVSECGFIPRSALEIIDSSQTRIDKISSIINDCRWGIHDISRTELNDSGLPRFNMPLELGLFLGAKRFGDHLQQRKSALILDVDRFRYQAFVSDIAGQDITPHNGDSTRIISAIRDWLSDSQPRHADPILGGAEICTRFVVFQADLPRLCSSLRLNSNAMTFSDYTRIISYWARRAASMEFQSVGIASVIVEPMSDSGVHAIRS